MRKNGIEWNEPQSRAALYTPAALRRRWRRRELFGKLRGMFTLENGGKYGESALNFYKIVYIYALGGLVGTVWETTFEFLNGNGFVWCNGSICTPFNFVYGAGGVVIILCLRKRKKWREVFLIGSIGAGAVEYVLSFLDELFLGTRSWDYSDYFLNIDGRTNIPYMLFFGALCVVVVFLVWQPLNSWLDSLPKRVMKVLAVILAVIILFDLLLPLAVQFRYSARMAGRAPLTFIGECFDRVFDDEYMRLHFPAKEFM